MPFLSYGVNIYQPTSSDNAILKKVDNKIQWLSIGHLEKIKTRILTIIDTLETKRTIFLLQSIYDLASDEIQNKENELETDEIIEQIFDNTDFDIYVWSVRRLMMNYIVWICMDNPEESTKLEAELRIDNKIISTKWQTTINDRLTCYAVSRPIFSNDWTLTYDNDSIITLEVDPNNRYDETNENNNTFILKNYTSNNAKEQIFKE